MNKIFAVYKPMRISSFDVIRKLKKKYVGEKIGHGGTLDPMATGVLVVGVGREATKRLGKVLKGTDKEYIAEIELGKTSSTDDSEGDISAFDGLARPELTEVSRILKLFVGEIEQVPPKYSAVKIKGKRAYKRAREGENFKIEAKKVNVKKITVLDYKYPILKIKVVSGSGVYIRSLARDIGKKLSVGGYLKSLIRTRVGEYNISDSIGIF